MKMIGSGTAWALSAEVACAWVLGISETRTAKVGLEAKKPAGRQP